MADRSQLVMSYTIFHIGVYLTLGTAGLATLKAIDIQYLAFPIICFIAAGMAGGVIASNLPEHASFEDFEDKPIGFWCFKLFKYEIWARAEHLFFWVGLLSGLAILWWYWTPETALQSCWL